MARSASLSQANPRCISLSVPTLFKRWRLVFLRLNSESSAISKGASWYHCKWVWRHLGGARVCHIQTSKKKKEQNPCKCIILQFCNILPSQNKSVEVFITASRESVVPPSEPSVVGTQEIWCLQKLVNWCDSTSSHPACQSPGPVWLLQSAVAPSWPGNWPISLNSGPTHSY